MLEAVELARQIHRFDLWAWVVMPEHVHLLIWPRKGEDGPVARVGPILTAMKQSVSKRAVRWVKANAPEFLPKMLDISPDGKRVARFWQRGGDYDRNMYSPEKIWDVIRYIHNNLVERQLCENRLDWQWSSAIEFARPSEGLLSLNRESLPDEPWIDRSLR